MLILMRLQLNIFAIYVTYIFFLKRMNYLRRVKN